MCEDEQQRMTMRDITELMELVTAMLFAFRRWNGGVMFVTRERLHEKWPTMKRTTRDSWLALCVHVDTVAVVAELRLMGLMGLMGTLLSTPWMGQTGSSNGKHVATALSWFASGRSESCCILTEEHLSFSSTKSGLSAVKSESCGYQYHIVGNLLKVPYAAALATGWSSLPRYSDAGCCPAALVVPVPPSEVPAERSRRLLRVEWVGKQEKAKNPPGRDLTLADLLSLRERLFPSTRFVIQRIESATPWPAAHLGSTAGARPSPRGACEWLETVSDSEDRKNGTVKVYFRK